MLSCSSLIVVNIFSDSASESAVSPIVSSVISLVIESVEFNSLAATAESEHKRTNKIVYNDSI